MPIRTAIPRPTLGAPALLFLALGCAGFFGTWAGGSLADRQALRIIQAVPLTMALVTLGLLGAGGAVIVIGALLAIWGAMNTALSIGWMAWLSQNIGDEAEAAGSLMVAAIQAAILFGGALGGALLDSFGIAATFGGSIVLSALAVMVIGSGRRLLRGT